MNNKEIGARIKALRMTLGLSQLYVADKAGIKQESYRKFETGETHIVNPHLEAITKALDTDISELFRSYNFDQERRLLEEQFNARYDQTRLDQQLIRDKYEQLIREKDKVIALMEGTINSLRSELEELKKK